MTKFRYQSFDIFGTFSNQPLNGMVITSHALMKMVGCPMMVLPWTSDTECMCFIIGFETITSQVVRDHSAQSWHQRKRHVLSHHRKRNLWL